MKQDDISGKIICSSVSEELLVNYDKFMQQKAHVSISRLVLCSAANDDIIQEDGTVGKDFFA